MHGEGGEGGTGGGRGGGRGAASRQSSGSNHSGISDRRIKIWRSVMQIYSNNLATCGVYGVGKCMVIEQFPHLLKGTASPD